MIYKFIIFSHNIEEIPLAKTLAKELNMEVKFDQNKQTNYDMLSEEQKRRAEELSGIKLENTDEKRLLDLYRMKKSNWFFCSDLFECPQINWNGDLLGCCVYENKYNINVFKSGLFKSLNDMKILYVKRMLTDFSVPPKDDIPCSKCMVYEILKKQNYEMLVIIILLSNTSKLKM